MKLAIGICDDDTVQVDTISSFLQKYIKDYELELIKAYSGEEFLKKLEDRAPDIVFLDVEMKELNGLQIGKKIRTKHPDTIIIFITGHRKFALDAFKIKTMDYLIKPVTENRFKALSKDLLIRLEQLKLYEENSKAVVFKFRDNTIKLKHSEIHFFEKSLRKITVHSDKGSFSFYESMDKLLNKLNREQFIQCHNSFIVNKAKILELKHDSIFISEFDRTIPVSRKNKMMVRDILEKNLFL